MIKVDQSQKLAKFALRGWFGERPDDLNVVFQRCNSCTADMVTEKVKRLGTKTHLFGLIVRPLSTNQRKTERQC